jgi:endonuclease YncB( thermonuclease family)
MRTRFPAHTSSLLLVIIAALVFLAAPAFAAPFTARVVGIHDGDTITVLTPDKRQVKIRFAEIDAPELSQPYGKKAKRLLSRMVFGKDVSIVPMIIDKYGRTVARVSQGNSDINLALVQSGAAWAYRTYLTDPSLLEAEAEARNARIGIWALQPDQITPPWEWRDAKTAKDISPVIR